MQREQEIIEGGFKAAKPNGFFMVSTGPKITHFSPKQLLKTEDASPGVPSESLQFNQALTVYQPLKLPPGIYDKITPWDEKWDRTLTLLDAKGQRWKIAQRLTKLTPEYARVDAKTYNWTPTS